MTDGTPETILREDYKAPDFLIETVELDFDLDDHRTEVKSRMTFRRNPAAEGDAALVLDGEMIELKEVVLDGTRLSSNQYQLEDETLSIPDVPDRFTLEITNLNDPKNNSALTGLYQSNGMFCTQCEAQGFRRITYFLDRPDVMASFTTRITAYRDRFPVLLSNGNLIEERDLDDNRHCVVWEDPHKKPAYLFALVGGDLKPLEDSFVTMSGRKVDLKIWVEESDLEKCGHAMASLKKAMKWDEDVFGLEYDLDIFNIVAVSHFNMGAMENKSLNVFNTKLLLVSPETATDADFLSVEAVIAHEYFHNWTGNRVTCRDWFQLSLKEGLTVFRDQEFSSDMGSRAVNRIDNVRLLRTAQFPEDASPTAHPVRPDSYMEINNFYTATVYEKGAEVVRMYHTLLGAGGFRKGIDLYFQRHDGQAVTCEDFALAMEGATGVDLGQFRRWYEQAGTPHVSITGHYDEASETFTLSASQRLLPTPGQETKKPMHIPLAVSLLGKGGTELPLTLKGEEPTGKTSRVLNLTEAEQVFEFTEIREQPVPSLLRDFSAPVHLESDLTSAERRFLLANDTDPFNRWEAGQILAAEIIQTLLATEDETAWSLNVEYLDAVQATLTADIDYQFQALALSLPGIAYLIELSDQVDIDRLHAAREFLRRGIAEHCRQDFEKIYETMASAADYSVEVSEIGRRSMRNLALSYLMALDEDEIVSAAYHQYCTATNMTDRMAALIELSNTDAEARSEALADFYTRFEGDALVIDKWFSVQAMASRENMPAEVVKLTEHAAFDIKTPNRFRSVVGAFAMSNPVAFHDKAGRGYKFLADQILKLDPVNPQTAVRLLAPLTRWAKQTNDRQALMKGELERILGVEELSRDAYEIASKGIS